MNLTIEDIFKMIESNPKIYTYFIFRIGQKKKDEFGEYYSTRICLICLN